MLTRARLTAVLRAVFRRRRFEDGLSEELRFHLDEYTADLVQSGIPLHEAARRARLEFGSVEMVKDDCRRARGLRILDDIAQDLRYAVRMMRRAPGFTATALATIALCLGANVSIFAVVHAILLRPLPYPASDRLVRIYNTYPKAGVPDDGASVTNYYERRGALAAFSGVSLYREGSALVGEPGSTEREPVMRVTADFFATLGAGPVRGRAFVEGETSYETSRVAILTDALWRQRFNADPAVVGRRIHVDGADRLIVGVLPEHFRFLSSKARLYVPLPADDADRSPMRRHSGSSSQMLARLAAGVTLEAAQSAIDAHNAAMETGSPMAKRMAEAGFRSVVAPLQAEHVAAVGPMLLIVQAGAMCLLLIGGVNLVNLLLIRATARSKELAVRQAIGGSRSRIGRQVLVETTLLVMSGAVLGVALGAAGIRLLKSLGTDTLPLGSGIAFDAPLALASAAAAIVLALMLAIPVAWLALRAPAATALTSESRAVTAGAGIQRLRHAFLVAQVALAFALLAGAGLLAVSLREVLAIPPGFQPGNVLSGQLTVPVRSYPDGAARRVFVDRLLRELESQPGVTSAGVATNVPFSGREIKSAITVTGWVPRAGESVRGHYGYGVGGRYFAALGIPLIAGRLLEPLEIDRGDRTVVVDEDFARRYWRDDRTAVGHRLFAGPKEGPDSEAYTIVGVVGAIRQAGLTDTAATGAVFFPYGSRFDTELFVVVRTAMAPESVASVVRQAIRRIDPALAISDLRTMDARISDSLVARRSPAVLAALFACLALVLTGIGTYGVISYAVAQRRREIALRMALGARPEQVRRAFLLQGLRLVTIGSMLGLAAAWIAARAMQSVLFGVAPVHPPTLAAAAALIAAVALAACLLPSRRAARISPMEALSEP